MENHAQVLERGADPFLTQYRDGRYHYVTSGEYDEAILQAWPETVHDLARTALRPLIFEKPKDAAHNIWAPKAFEFNIGTPEYERVVYYASSKEGLNTQRQRLHVLRAINPFDNESTYDYIGPLETDGGWAIDATVLTLMGDNFLIFSGQEEGNEHDQRLYISKLLSPTKVDCKRHCIGSPDMVWERGIDPVRGEFGINEGPAILKQNGRTWCAFAASTSWIDSYCIGIMELVGNNPLDPKSWVKRPAPLLAQTDGLYGPGHCSFVTDAAGDTHMLYHSAVRSGSGWERKVNYTRVYFDEDGDPFVPKFVKPKTAVMPFALPATEGMVPVLVPSELASAGV